jgi:hypothetical protein
VFEHVLHQSAHLYVKNFCHENSLQVKKSGNVGEKGEGDDRKNLRGEKDEQKVK